MRGIEPGLRALSAEEIAFLSTPWHEGGDFAARLGGSLATTLSARLRMPVSLTAQSTAPPADTAMPVWRIDTALSALWAARRLGCREAHGGTAPFVPRGLLAALDAVLAERWLDGAGAASAVFDWTLHTAGCETRLGLQLPAAAQEMTRWAQETIRK